MIEDEKYIEGWCYWLYLLVLFDSLTIRRTYSAKNGFFFFCDWMRDDVDDDVGVMSVFKDFLGCCVSGDEEIDGLCLWIMVMR